MKYLKILGTTMALSLTLLAVPHSTQATTEVSLRNVKLVGSIDVTSKTMNVTTTDTTPTDFVISYSTTSGSATTVSQSFPAIRGFVDWQAGNQLNITGLVTGYENDKLKISARKIENVTPGITVRTWRGVIEGASSSNLMIVKKEGSKYSYSNVAYTGDSTTGPTLNGITADDLLNPNLLGTTVEVADLYKINTTTKISELSKTLTIRKVIQPSARSITRAVVITGITGNDLVYFGNPSKTTWNLNLTRGNKIAIQNNTADTIYLIPKEYSTNFSSPNASTTTALKITAKTSKEVTLKSSAVAGEMGFTLGLQNFLDNPTSVTPIGNIAITFK